MKTKFMAILTNINYCCANKTIIIQHIGNNLNQITNINLDLNIIILTTLIKTKNT